MKKITLNGPASDNLGNFCDGGAELTVSNRNQAGHISEERAKDLLARHGAHAVAEKAKKPAAAKPAGKRSRAKVTAKPATPAPPPAQPTGAAEGEAGKTNA